MATPLTSNDFLRDGKACSSAALSDIHTVIQYSLELLRDKASTAAMSRTEGKPKEPCSSSTTWTNLTSPEHAATLLSELTLSDDVATQLNSNIQNLLDEISVGSIKNRDRRLSSTTPSAVRWFTSLEKKLGPLSHMSGKTAAIPWQGKGDMSFFFVRTPHGELSPSSPSSPVTISEC
eukprot:Protomagalhaensia_sp_Gyna_25__5575@NODE_765_length_2661_cov_8_701373_g600_i0_p3_GENE_NODE_765_length_2661_cov_8_701373_g600_i0NODE_765_length_2661_cov_8_701373_g600_i0_p3_ORF_typecomplete_len177_score12_32_NODE_765_length_2661_cov_8_701373_g600_i047577